MNKPKTSSINKTVNSFVVYIIIIFIAIAESLITLSKIFRKGIFKNEVLSTTSKIGFDFEIRRKS